MTISDYEHTLAALMLWRESRSHPHCMAAIYHVVLHRMQDRRWPNDMAGVILQRKQFSSFNSNDPNAVKWPRAGSNPFAIAMATIDFPGDDPTGGANHYHSYTPGHEHWPWWAKPETMTVKIGPFRFYRR